MRYVEVVVVGDTVTDIETDVETEVSVAYIYIYISLAKRKGFRSTYGCTIGRGHLEYTC